MSDNNTTSESDTSIGSVTSEQVAVINTLSMVLSPISLSAATIGVLTFFYIRLKYPRLADRVTFRLAFATMVSDIGYVIFQILLNTQTTPTPLCTFIVWGFVFFSLTSIFFPTCIAIVSILNMFLFICQLIDCKFFEKY